MRTATAVTLILLAALAAAGQGQRDEVTVGMMNTLFEEQDEKKVFVQMEPFRDLVRRRTGVEGKFTVVRGAEAMGRQLKAGLLQLGVMHGWEYGWVRKYCPDCRPLLIAVSDTATLHAYILVPRTSAAKEIADLKGQTLALPRRAPHHTRFYLERLIGGDPAKVFKVMETATTDGAIEAVIEGQAQLTVVSGAALKVYRDEKPGRFNKLRVLGESPAFPAGVLVSRPGQGDPKVTERFRDALLTAHETAEGRQTLTLWRLTGFRAVPKDYEQQVDAIIKLYPPPSE